MFYDLIEGTRDTIALVGERGAHLYSEPAPCRRLSFPTTTQLFRHLSRPIKMIYWLFQWFWICTNDDWLTDWLSTAEAACRPQQARERNFSVRLSVGPSSVNVSHLGPYPVGGYTLVGRTDIDLFTELLIQLNTRSPKKTRQS